MGSSSSSSTTTTTTTTTTNIIIITTILMIPIIVLIINIIIIRVCVTRRDLADGALRQEACYSACRALALVRTSVAPLAVQVPNRGKEIEFL